jgi:hypothetical protein
MPEYIYYRPVPYQVEAAETLREIGDVPHILLRISFRGGHFPHRDAPAFAQIESQSELLDALYCEVDDDEAGLRAYFPTDVPLEGRLVVGYEDDLVAEFALDRLKLEPARLDEQRIETAFHRVTQRDLGKFKRRR